MTQPLPAHTGEHTPGPWCRNIAPATKYPTIFSGRNTHVAYVTTKLPEAEVEANIRLIAAAPDLLAALRSLMDDNLCYDGNNIVIRCDSHSDAMQRARVARSAILAATGGAGS